MLSLLKIDLFSILLPAGQLNHLSCTKKKQVNHLLPIAFSRVPLFPVYSSIPPQSATVINRQRINHHSAKWLWVEMNGRQVEV